MKLFNEEGQIDKSTNFKHYSNQLKMNNQKEATYK